MKRIDINPEYDDVMFEVLGEINIYSVRLRMFRGIMYADVYNGDELVSAGVRCCPGCWLIVRGYNGSDGNFRIETNLEDYPFTKGMGSLYSLVYYTNKEISELEE